MTKNSQPDYLGAYFQNPDMDGVWYGVKGMKWGVRRDLKAMDASAREGYLKTKESPWLEKANSDKVLKKVSRNAAKEVKREIKALNREYREKGVNLRRDAKARSEYVERATSMTQSTLNRLANKYAGKSKTGLYEARAEMTPDGRLQIRAQVKVNRKTIKQLEQLRNTKPKPEMKHSDESDELIVEFPLDEEGYPITDNLEHSSLMTMEEVDEAMDAVQYGVKGMQWGVRRSSRELRNAAAARKPAEKKGESKPADNKTPSGSSGGTPAGNSIQNHVETSTQRYARLEAQTKGGGAKDFTEQDLKFFNARTEALGKVAKMYEKKPGLLASLAQETLKTTTKNVMQDVAGSLAKQYISKPLVDSLAGSKKPAESFLDRVNRTAGEKHAEDQFKSAVDKALSELRKNK